MYLLKNLNIFVICSILLFIDKTSALKCWRCSSDATNSKFCVETLDLTVMSEQQMRWYYVECADTPNGINTENLIPKCRISLILVNDVPAYTRSCFWEEENVPSNSCAIHNHTLSFVKTVACNTCNEDGCNDKLIRVSEEEDNKNNLADNQNNSAMFAVLSKIVFATFMLFIIIGY